MGGKLSSSFLLLSLVAVVLLFFFAATGYGDGSTAHVCTSYFGMGQNCDTRLCVLRCLRNYQGGQGYCTKVILPDNTLAPACGCEHVCGA